MGNRLIEALKTGQRYIVQVRAKNDAGLFGAYSDVVEITTSTEVTPRAPTNVVLTGTVAKWVGAKYKMALILTWTAPIETIISKYEAVLEEYDGVWGVADVTNAEAYPAKTATEQKWVDYTPSGQYRARIRAISKGNTVGAWSDYATFTTTFTSDLPTPTGLALKQDGKKITASVAAISQITYPQLAGYRFYASKQTGFTPGAGNLISEPKSNKLTFQDAYDSVSAVIEEIDIGDTIYVRVSAFDAAGNESAKCAEVSVLAGGAAPDAPASVVLSLTFSTIIGRVYNVKAASAWTAPANVELSGYEQEIYNAINGGGTLEKTLSPGKNATASNWTDNDPNVAYSTRLRAINKWGRTGSWSSWANASAIVDSSAPASPTGVVLNATMDSLEIKVAKNTENDMFEYRVYINTTNSAPTGGDTEHIIKRIAHPTTREIIPIGAATEAGTNIITVDYDTTYYIWVSAVDVAGLESALVATSPASGQIHKTAWLQHFTTPWKMKGLSMPKTPGVAGTTVTRNCPSGKVMLLAGYELLGDTITLVSGMGIVHDGGTSWLEQVTIGLTRNPQYTNGCYAEYKAANNQGFAVATVAGGDPAHNWFRTIEFDQDANITVIVKAITDGVTYTVTSGKKLVLTYVHTSYASSIFIQIYEGGGWVNLWDVNNQKWDITQGVIEIPSGSQIRASVAQTIIVSGYEVKVP